MLLHLFSGLIMLNEKMYKPTKALLLDAPVLDYGYLVHK
jgi:hypothetical protein